MCQLLNCYLSLKWINYLHVENGTKIKYRITASCGNDDGIIASC